MARRKRRRRRGVGSIITTSPRKMSGLGQLNRPGSFMGSVFPPIIGAGIAALTTLGVRYFADIAASPTQASMYKNAPWIGLGAGALSSIALYMLGGTPAALSSFAASAGVSGTLVLNEQVLTRTATQAGVRGLGAVVPEYSGVRGLGRGGVGAIVAEPHASRGYGAGTLGSYGETLNLGSVNPSAFGTPGFAY